jgi:hypothetical protein
MIRIWPITYIWNGQYMVPLPRFIRRCEEQFVVSEEYPLTMLDARSRKSHSHYFACIHEIFTNLPDGNSRFKSEDQFRKHTLIEAGYCSMRTIVCESEGHAERLAINVDTEFCPVIIVKGNVVVIYEAESQSAASMGHEKFQASKTAVLEAGAAAIGVTVAQLKKEAEKHFRPEPARRS